MPDSDSPVDSAEVVIGVLSDTHIPDRSAELHPAILPFFRSEGVSLILHAGDISSPVVLEELRAAAPVEAVRGNRDWLANRDLPVSKHLEVGGIGISLQHGHGGTAAYLVDKLAALLSGFQLERYLKQVARTAGDSRVVVFGHTHRPFCQTIGGRLWFNPGPAGVDSREGPAPSVGLLRFTAGDVRGEIHSLRGYRLKNRRWQPEER